MVPLSSALGTLAVLLSLTFVLTDFPDAYAHPLFNSDEENVGRYKIMISTSPEIPGPNEPTRILVAMTDRDGNDIIDVVAGLKIFNSKEVLIHEVEPRVYTDGHIDYEYTFPDHGMYVVEISLFDPYTGNDVTAKFNIGILQTFGYIFFSMIIVGAFFPATLVGAILLMRRRKAKQSQS